jgi:adenylyltransferase/sulfurtransferase
VPSCSEGGVLGVLPGILGSLQANEVIKVISGVGDPLSGRLFIFDAASFMTRTLKVMKNPENPLTGENPSQFELIDYERFCGLKTSGNSDELAVKEIDVFELSKMKSDSEDFQLIDVREPYEFEISNIEGELMPLHVIEDFAGKISRDKKVVIHCRSGVRSAKAIKQLEEEHGFENLYNLKGGILAYAEEIDHSLAKY